MFNDKITPKEIAVFLRNNLDYDTKIKKSHLTIAKTTVGEYFGQRKEKNQQVYE